MHQILDHHEIGADLTERCIQLAERFSGIFGGPAVNDRPRAHVAAGQLRLELKEPGGNAAAQRILTHLVPEIERNGTDFWGTPLGRACGWWTGAGQLDGSNANGGTEIATPSPRIALLLGVSRQSVFQMIAKGKLKKTTVVGVDPADVRREMQARWPL